MRDSTYWSPYMQTGGKRRADREVASARRARNPRNAEREYGDLIAIDYEAPVTDRAVPVDAFMKGLGQ